MARIVHKKQVEIIPTPIEEPVIEIIPEHIVEPTPEVIEPVIEPIERKYGY